LYLCTDALDIFLGETTEHHDKGSEYK